MDRFVQCLAGEAAGGALEIFDWAHQTPLEDDESQQQRAGQAESGAQQNAALGRFSTLAGLQGGEGKLEAADRAALIEYFALEADDRFAGFEWALVLEEGFAAARILDSHELYARIAEDGLDDRLAQLRIDLPKGFAQALSPQLGELLQIGLQLQHVFFLDGLGFLQRHQPAGHGEAESHRQHDQHAQAEEALEPAGAADRCAGGRLFCGGLERGRGVCHPRRRSGPEAGEARSCSLVSSAGGNHSGFP
ncbi:LolA-related protein [Uliginosibacterium sp. 31-12]|uniref:LolA-related protein n=1 Tax=Uliginosibacterium sp. 31-12 TaxID=3062781 RepID=UPI0034C6765C